MATNGEPGKPGVKPDGKINVKVIDVPAKEVTLLEDRARVLRRGAVDLPQGLVKVRIEGVAPVLSDKTLTGEVVEQGASMTDMRVSRRLMVSFDEPDRPVSEQARAVEQALVELDDQIDKLESERVLVERHASGFEQIATMTFTELSEDVSWGRAIGSEWHKRLEELRSAERALRERMVDLASEIEEKRRERQRLHERMVHSHDRAEREWASLEADIVVERAGAYTLVFEYVVPGACWRPYHTARLMAPLDSEQDKGMRLAFTTDACVWQNTGEDWRDVELVLSTERASLGTEPPTLASDIVRVRKKSDAVVVEAREREIQTTGLGAGAEGAAAAAELPGIDDGGLALNLRARRRASVPSDGKPYRVEIQSFEAEAKVELVAMPELAACVFVKSIQTNASKGPILAGPVDLIRQSGLVGRTSALFIAAGERFELGWGPEPDLRIKRETEVTEEKSRLLSSWVDRTHEIEVRFSNLGGREHKVRVTERVPVSEIDKVKIEVDTKETTAGKRPDQNGLITWEVIVPAAGHERIALHYTLKKHEDVVGI